MKITKVYTKSGDGGKTSLVGGERIAKNHCRLDAYGTVDELNSHIGLLSAMTNNEYCEVLERIQSCLFNVGTHLATDQSTTPLYASANLPEGETGRLECMIDDMMGSMPIQEGFILPGGTVAAAQAHVCRTVCRRAERCILTLAEQAEVSPSIIQYINRLSDFFFVFAKKINFIAGGSEKKWCNYCE